MAEAIRRHIAADVCCVTDPGLVIPGSKIICGFPGVGKTTAFEALSRSRPGLASDSGSMAFLADRASWPGNYLDHLASRFAIPGHVHFVFPHREVLEGLTSRGLRFHLAYPAEGLRNEYEERYRARGNDGVFMDWMDRNYEAFLTACREARGCTHHVLAAGRTLSDAMPAILGPVHSSRRPSGVVRTHCLINSDLSARPADLQAAAWRGSSPATVEAAFAALQKGLR